MNRKAIIVIGNMCSGKSTLCKKLLKKREEYQYISLDQVRNQLAMSSDLDSNFMFERACEKECERQIKNSTLLIFESIGTSQFYKRIFRWLKSNKYEIEIIKINVAVRVCIARFENRQQLDGQVPAMYSLSYKEKIRMNHEKIQGVMSDYNFNSVVAARHGID
ncbi:MAG: AAA family ATPase [Reichenbachiella sp.]